MPNDDWTSRELKLLVDNWLIGMPVRIIAERIGKTKSAITGKAHRLKLPRRENPIKPKIRSRHVSKATKKRYARLNPPPKPKEKRFMVAAEEPKPKVELGSRPCQWPLWGDQQRPTHVYCDKPVKLGKSYCPEHFRRAVGKMMKSL